MEPAASWSAAPTSPAPVCARGQPYAPRRPEASPLYRVLADHFESLERVHEERFEPSHGPLRSTARRAAGRLLDCARLEHGFARVRCGACRAEFLVASLATGATSVPRATRGGSPSGACGWTSACSPRLHTARWC